MSQGQNSRGGDTGGKRGGDTGGKRNPAGSDSAGKDAPPVPQESDAGGSRGGDTGGKRGGDTGGRR